MASEEATIVIKDDDHIDDSRRSDDRRSRDRYDRRSRSPVHRSPGRHSNYRSRDRSRSRSRSPPSGGRRSSPRLTITEIMRSDDPKYLNSRLFIGNLPTVKCDKAELDAIFSRYGKILGISMHQGFGFVQYDSESDAKKAVDGEHGSLLKGQILDIRIAAEGRNKKAKTQNRDSRDDRPRPTSGRDDMARSGHPPAAPREPFYDPYRREAMIDAYRDPYYRDIPARDLYSRDLPPRDLPPRDLPPRDLPPRDLPPRDIPPRDIPRDLPPRDISSRDFRDIPLRELPVVEYPIREIAAAAKEKPIFDCQVIRHSDEPSLRKYTDVLMDKLRSLGLRSHQMLLQVEADLPSLMDDASRRNIPYSITLRLQNQQHSSLTLNVLWGTPQEHRNMPLEDALLFLKRNFEGYLSDFHDKSVSVTSAAKTPVTPVTSSLSEFIPPDKNTLYLLNLLADNRILTISELDTVMDYLQRRRQKLLEKDDRARSVSDGHEGRNSVSSYASNDAYRRSDNYNGSGSNPQDFKVTYPHLDQISSKSQHASNQMSLNFEDPGVKKALDNLIQSGPILPPSNGNSDQKVQPSLPYHVQNSLPSGQGLFHNSGYNQSQDSQYYGSQSSAYASQFQYSI